MYISRLILNPRSRQVQREVAAPYQRHRTIMAAFPSELPEGERILHRLEYGKNSSLTLLVQSHSAPDWSWLHEKNYLAPEDPFSPYENPAIKRFDLALHEGQDFLFRLRANPTVKKKRPGKRHSNRVPLVREERQREWLHHKADQHGLRVLEVNVHGERHRSGWIRRDHEQRHKLDIFMVQYDGILEVIDPQQMEEAVRNGIGPAKAFGCGLLSLAPARLQR
jgi:CRISPR system Cascade subunit CasE